MQDSPCAPTPTPPDRCRNRRQRRWAASWNKWCRAERQKEIPGGCSPGISDRFWFFPLVGQGVSLNPEPLAFGYKESPQTSRLRGFSGASDVTRTRDLLITKGTKALQLALNGYFQPFSLAICILFDTPCPTDSVRIFPRMGQDVGQRCPEEQVLFI